MSLIVRGSGQEWRGRARPSPGPGQLRLSVPGREGPVRHPLGGAVEVAADGAVGTGELVAVEQVGDEIELLVRTPLAPSPTPSDEASGSERRVWLRVSPRAQGVPVPIRLADGAPSARNLVGRLCDVSPRGLGLLFPLAAEERLCRTRGLDCTFELVPGEGAREWRCEIANRRLVPDGVRYGLRFHLAPEEEVPAFELQWDCGCGATRLLAHTHAWCPACGAARPPGGHHRPHWEDLVRAATHRFTGVWPCPRCSTAHSGLARYCGHCGADLPVKAP